METLSEQDRWIAMIWCAHSHARTGELTKANLLLDLVQVQAGTRAQSAETDEPASAAVDAAIELRRALHVMARR